MEHWHLRVKDNQFGKLIRDLSPQTLNDENCERVIEDIEQIADVKLSNNSNLLVFPHCLGDYGDGIEDLSICSLNKVEKKISTGNLMGFIGFRSMDLTINSRFAKDDGQDYFLHYMLQKVFCINMFDWKHSYSEQDIFDFLLYLFPYYLNKALSQGLFKEYRRFEYNDSKVRGTINVSRHIQHNIPFAGKVAYNTKEYSYDNRITQLIRHTIEYISKHEIGSNVLRDKETQQNVRFIIDNTPTYSHNDLQKILSANLKEVHHSFLKEYTVLQKICLQILRHEGLKYGDDKREVYGILFDGAWLWEEYLNTILMKKGYKHPKNKEDKGGFRMFSKSEDDSIDNNYRLLYPDFHKDDIILDAKYKHLNGGVGREDLYQVVTYMYCKKAKYGGYLFPSDTKDPIKRHALTGYGGTISIIPFNIPNPSDTSWNTFSDEMLKSESFLLENIQNMHQSAYSTVCISSR